MILVSHPTGNANVRALLKGLAGAGADYNFFTAIACDSTQSWIRWLPRALRREFLRRDHKVPRERIRTQPGRECIRLLAKRLNLTWLQAHENGWACIDAVYRALDQRVAAEIRADLRGRWQIVHAYEDGALETFRAARERGLLCSYELPIAYWETAHRLLREEAERFPDWEPTLVGTRDSSAKLERKTEELELADTVICPSRFVWQTLPARIRRQKRCITAPFGSPQLTDVPLRRKRSFGPLRVLFAGSMTQRKGLADLFKAVELLGRRDVELVVLGSLMQPLEFYQKRCRGFVYERPRPHHEVLNMMQQCDVLALPSIVEGRALVQQEALSCGLPLIVTANAGGEDLIEEGNTGFLVPIRSPEKIAERIAWMADHRDSIPEMSECCKLKAASVTWAAYSQQVLDAMTAHQSHSTLSRMELQPCP